MNKHPIRESHVVNACIRWLFAQGCYVWRQNTGGHKQTYTRKDGSHGQTFIKYGTLGCADIIGVTPNGRFLAVECKAGNNGLSDPQELFGERIQEKNGIYIVAYGVDDLELQKETILAKHYTPMLADGALRDNRVKPTGRRVHEEVGV